MRRLIFFCLAPLLYYPLAAQVSDTCLQLLPQHLVVIGSSTAAGVGPAELDSAWVWRYRRSLQGLHPRYRVTNLALGGYQTYHLMPDGYEPRAGAPPPDPQRNITRALALKPHAVIVNLPSNDASAGVDAATQMQNFRLMARLAAEKGVPLWICTPQPREFGPAEVAIQLALLDSIQAEFPVHFIDFWQTFADAEGLPRRRYDSGDGIHLNDAGHQILWQRVLAAEIPRHSFRPEKQPHYVLGLADRDRYCSVSADQLSLRWVNLGQEAPVHLHLRWQQGEQQVLQRLALQQPTCEVGQRDVFHALPSGGTWQGQAWVVDQQGRPASDTLRWRDRLNAVAALPPQKDSVQAGQAIDLQANAEGSLHWYADSTLAQVVGEGSSLALKAPERDTAFWMSQWQGPLLRHKELRSPDRYDRDFPGLMFDLVARRALTLDSLALPINGTGLSHLRVWYRRGPHREAVNRPAAWLRWDSLSVVIDTGHTWLALPAKDLEAGDTLAVYVQALTPGHRLGFGAPSDPRDLHYRALILRPISSLRTPFGADFYPRQANLRLRYHFTDGQCPSLPSPYHLHVLSPQP